MAETGSLLTPATVGRIKELYDLAKTNLAYNLLLELEKALEEGGDGEKETREAMAKEEVLLYYVRHEAESVHEFLRQLEETEGWELAKEAEGCRTSFKLPEGSDTYLIKLKGIVNSPAFDVLACVNEIDLYRTWIPTMTASDIVLELSQYKRMIKLQVEAPSPISWVVSPRDMVLYGYGADLMEENKLIAMAQTPSKESLAMLRANYGFRMPPRRVDIVRMDCKLAGMLFEPLGANRTRVSVLTNVDPMMTMPYWVINHSTKHMAHMIMVFLRKQADNLNKEYRKRIEAKGTLYANIKERLAEGEKLKAEEEAAKAAAQAETATDKADSATA